MNRPIVLLSDFGTRDAYAGQMRAVITAIAPGAQLIDLTHDVEAFAVDEAAWLLETSLPYLPADAVIVAVVDPGVGTARRALAAAVEGRIVVGPDNGILSGVLPGEARPAAHGNATLVAIPPGITIHELRSPQFRLPNASATFHGRDVFAPAAAHLSCGVDLRVLGPPVGDVQALPAFCGRPGPMGELHGYVVHIDRYGNLITTIRAAELFPEFDLYVGDRTLGERVRTFASVDPGKLLLHADSSGFLAVAVHRGSAATETGVRRGDPVVVRCR